MIGYITRILPTKSYQRWRVRKDENKILKKQSENENMKRNMKNENKKINKYKDMLNAATEGKVF